MWKWYVLSIVVVLIMVRFIGTVDFHAQTKETTQMESRCQKTKAPVRLVIIGTSEDLAHGLFEALQKAECPRRLRIHCLEFQRDKESAAVIYERFVRLRGLYDCLFDEQITWTSLDGPKRPLEDLAMTLEASEVPIVGVYWPSRKFQLQRFWEKQLETSMLTLTDDSHMITGIPNLWPRLGPEGPPSLVWTPLHMNSGIVPLVFPGPLWFGHIRLIKNVVYSLLRVDDFHMSVLPFHASYGPFSYFGSVVFEPMPGNFDLTDCPKISKTVTREYLAKHKPMVYPKHCLGLDPDTFKPVEAVLKYGSLGAYKRAIQTIQEPEKATNKH